MGQLMTLLDELIRLGDQLPANVTAHPTKKL
jgi:hypothetical protein